MPRFKAAAGKVDLEAPVGGWMSGFASRLEPARGTHDPITARAVLLDDDYSCVVIIACDLLGLSPQSVAEMRQGIAERTNIPAGNILIACTHSHSAPTSMPMRGVMGYLNKNWFDRAKSKVVDLVCSLPARLEPAKLAHASTIVKGIGFNRQDKARPHDEELLVLSFEAESGKNIATITNYATHAVVLGAGYTLYSADFPGEVNRQIEVLRGGVGLYLQGACGDVNPSLELRGNFADCIRIGEKLARAAIGALEHAPRTSEVTLVASSKLVDVPVDPPPAIASLDGQIEEFEADKATAIQSSDRFKELLASTMLDWARELRTLIVRRAVPKTVTAEVFAAKINELRVVGLPFETYSDIGLRIKGGLRPLRAMFVGYANGLLGYCPTDWAKDQGGYGPADSFVWFRALLGPIGYGAADLLVGEAVALAKSL